MSLFSRKLAQSQLDQSLAAWRAEPLPPRPARGWICAIRTALGMSGRQLAERLGMTRQGVFVLEQSEQKDSISLKTLREAAEALNCELVYALVPRKALGEVVRDQAKQKMERRLKRIHQTMALEDQAVSPTEQQVMLNNKVEEFLVAEQRAIWDA